MDAARRATSGSGGRRSSGRSRSSRISARSSASTCRPASTPTSAASRPTTTTSSVRAAAGPTRSTTPVFGGRPDVARRTGYRVDDHRLELFGLCPACLGAQRVALMPGAALLVSFGAFLSAFAGGYLALRAVRYVGIIIAIGAGIRIGAAFFDLIPEAVGATWAATRRRRCSGRRSASWPSTPSTS